MMKHNSILSISLSILISTSYTILAQTQKEKTIETKIIKTDMYRGTKSKEAKAYYDKAYDFDEAKDYKNSIACYKKSIDIDSTFIDAYDNLGATYRQSGDFENAKKCYFKSIQLYPQGNMAYQNLGIVYFIEKNYPKALEQYAIMQKNDSTDAEGYYGAIQIYFLQNDYKSALKNASKTLEIYSATNSPYIGDAQYMLALSYYYSQDTKNAKIYFQQAKNSGITISNDIIKEFDLK